LRYRRGLKISQNSKNPPFKIFEDPYIPNHEKQLIWDAFTPSKTSQILKIKPFGMQSEQKCIPKP